MGIFLSLYTGFLYSVVEVGSTKLMDRLIFIHTKDFIDAQSLDNG
jgi:hypothetical protein